MINSVVLMGRMVADAELRTTTSGISVARFTIAVDRQFKQGDERKANFINCIAWRQTADFVSKYFRKGSMIALTGSIETNNYEDKNGNKRTSFEVIADNVSFCGSKREQKEEPDVNMNDIDIDSETDPFDDLPF